MPTESDYTLWYRGLQEKIYESPLFESLRPIVPLKPREICEFSDGHSLHGRARTHYVVQRESAQLMIKAINEYVRNDVGLKPLAQSPNMPNNIFVQKTIEQLREKGNAILPPISSEMAAEIRRYFETQDVLGPDQKSLVPLSEHPGNIAAFTPDTVMRCPHFFQLANDPKTLAAVEEYLGVTPTIIVVAAWWSMGGRPQPKDAQFFHFDNDDYKFCKQFIYLTDVDMESGPHAYLEGTHDASEIKERRKESENPESFDRFYFTLRKSDDDVKKYLGIQPKFFTGTAGSRFLIDTFGIHKGLLPTKNNRLILQITYGVSQAIQDLGRPVVFGSESAEHVPDFIAEAPYNYINRMLVDTSATGALKYWHERQEKVEEKAQTPALALGSPNNWSDPRTVQLYLKAIFQEGELGTFLTKHLEQNKIQITGFNQLMVFLRMFFKENIGWSDRDPKHIFIDGLKKLSDYELTIKKTLEAYDINKNPASAIFWPIRQEEPLKT